MKLKALLIVHAILGLIVGIGALLVPQQLMQLFGPTLDNAGLLIMQFGGVWLIGIALLAWFVRDADETDMRSGVVLAFLTTSIIALVVSVLAQIAVTPVMNTAGWLIPLINLLLVLGYGYFLLAGEEVAHSGSLKQTPQH